MRTSLSLLVLLTFILGVAFVSSALAQTSDGGPAVEEAAPTVPELAAADAGAVAPVEAAVAEAPDKPVDQGKGLYTSVKGGEWVLAFGFLGMLLGSISRFVLGRKWGFIKTKTGGYLISAGVGLGALGALIIEAGSFSPSMLPTAITATLAAMALHGPAKGLKKKITGEAPEA